MRVLVIGGGGREHAIIKSIKVNPKVSELYAMPGNAGIADDAVCVDIGATDLEKIRDFAIEKRIDFAVIAPDDPLVMGLGDILRAEGIRVFGPDKAAAIIEGSKSFSKDLMKKYNIPTAEYSVFTDIIKAEAYLEKCDFPTVIKADGLALGKGVIIAKDLYEGKKALEDMLINSKFGESGKKIVIEEFLTGPEVSVLAFTDGKTLIPMVSSMDHKRALDGDLGLNTGGMGTIAPNPFYTEEIANRAMKEIFIPTMEAMNKEGRTFKGCLYFGLMITEKGPMVIEYNCRFGDPETQVVLPLLETDLLTIMEAVEDGKLDEIDVKFSDHSACCVICASKGYPDKYEKKLPLDYSECEESVFVAGCSFNEKGDKVTDGGRVLGVTAVASNLKEAIEKAYLDVEKVKFENKYYRKDIGAKAL